MQTQACDFVLRDATGADQSFLEKLFAAVHHAEFAPLKLREPELARLLSQQARAQAESYSREFPGARDRLVLLGGLAVRPVGRLLVSSEAQADYLIDLTLLPPVQGWGLGSQLLRQVQDCARARGVPVRLHTRAAGRALTLFARFGFRAAGVHGQELLLEWTPDTLRGPGPETLAEAQTSGSTAPAPGHLLPTAEAGLHPGL